MKQTQPKTGRSQRKVSNVKLTERFRNRYLLLWVLVSVAHVAMVDILLFELFKERVAAMAVSEGLPGAAVMLPQALFITVLSIHGILLSLALLCLGIMTVHRVAGPYIAVKRTCNAIAAGNIFEQLKFRDYDGLDDVAESFNEMTATLRQQTAGSQKKEAASLLRVVGE
jgi:methyl-accepting chemotaxis protein